MDDDPGTTPVYLRVPPTTKRKFRRMAERRDVSMTELFIQWVDESDPDTERTATSVAS